MAVVIDQPVADFQAQATSGTSVSLAALRGQQVLPVPLAPSEDETHGHRSVLVEYIDAVKSGRKPETVSDDNIKSLSMVFGAIESARTGLPVSISVEGH